MSLLEPDHAGIRSFLGALEAKAAASMQFPTAGGGIGYNSSPFWGNAALGGNWGSLLPGSQYDYASEAGDLWLNSAVAVCIGWIADNFSEPVLKVERRQANGERKPVASHPLLDLMETPNDDYDADALWQATILSFLVSGNAYWIKARSPGGARMALYYAPHWEIEPKWTLDGRTFITGYEHVVDGKRFPLKKEDVVHFRHGLDPRNARSGFPQLLPVLREICTDNAANTYTAGILRNWGMPGVLITPEDDNVSFEPSEAQNIKSLWTQRTSGDNVGSPLVNTVRLKVQEMTASPEKMALDKLRGVPVARICAALKIPMSVVGINGDGMLNPTYANNAQDERKAYRNCLIPLQKSFARTLTRQLLPDVGGRPGQYALWDYSTVEAMSEDQQQLVDRLTKLYNGGIISNEEAREKAGYGDTKPGQTFMTPRGATLGVSGDVPLGQAMQVAAPGVNEPGNQAPPTKVAAPDSADGGRGTKGGPEIETKTDDDSLGDSGDEIARTLGLFDRMMDNIVPSGTPASKSADRPEREDDALPFPLDLKAASAVDEAAARDLLLQARRAANIPLSNRPLSPDDRRAILAALADIAEGRMRADARTLLDAIGPEPKSLASDAAAKVAQWKDSALRFLRRAYLAAALALTDPMTPKDRAALDRAVGVQVGFLDKFAEAITDGSAALDGTLVARAGLYGAGAWQAAESVAKGHAQDGGASEGIRILDEGAQHCETCPEEADKGWTPINEVLPIGQSPCGNRCRCYAEYR